MNMQALYDTMVRRAIAIAPIGGRCRRWRDRDQTITAAVAADTVGLP
jgi:hypothetical protein